MRDPNIDRLLTEVRQAVANARAGGATIHACVWDATAAAVDADAHRGLTREARQAADAATAAVAEATIQLSPAAPVGEQPHA